MSDWHANAGQLFIGTAGWSIPREQASHVTGEGAHLQRYARVFRCAEINSSFYRPHRPGTYRRWAAATPDGFLFSVKVPRALTHEGALAPDRLRLQTFLEEARSLGDRLGPLLLQLPPKNSFNAAVANAFFTLLRELHPTGDVVLEPRHVSWFTPDAEALLRSFRIARVAADPMRVPEAMTPAGDPATVYYRLHGSPRTYYSPYDEAFLVELASTLNAFAARGGNVWCIFDNTASGAALGDALKLQAITR